MLIKCPECKKTISSSAEACPHCGYRMSKEEKDKAIDDAVTNPPKEEIRYEDEGSAGGGFALGFFLGLIGLIIAIAINKSATRKGAVAGFFVQFFIGLFFVLIYACSAAAMVS